MNLRILKKLSKRAAQLLPHMGCTLEAFPAEPYENYHGARITERKHMARRVVSERRRAMGRERVLPRPGGLFLLLDQPDHPLKGTMMVGWMSGYYEPEWEETDTWTRLRDWVIDHHTYRDEVCPLELSPEARRRMRLRFRTPRAVFLAVPDVIAAHQRREAERAESARKWREKLTKETAA